MEGKMKRLAILGAPGSGKGTQTYRIAQKYNLKHIVVGDAVKQEIRDKTELGKLLYEYTSVGKFVPSKIVMDVLNEQIHNLEVFDGFIIDTAPINMDQKYALKDLQIDGVIWLKISVCDILKRRILERKICPQCRKVTNTIENPTDKCAYCGATLEHRYDDNITTINRRIEQYKKETMPVVRSYREEGILIEVNGEQDKEAVFEEICQKLDKFFEKDV